MSPRLPASRLVARLTPALAVLAVGATAAGGCGSAGGEGAGAPEGGARPDAAGQIDAPADGVGSLSEASSEASVDGSSVAEAGPDATGDDAGGHDAAADARDAGKCFVKTPGFYLSPSGNDTNGCSLAAPCKSFERAQAAMGASKTIKTTYVRAGTYSRPTSYQFSDGEQWLGYPCDPPHSAVIDARGLAVAGAAFKCESCSDVTMWNFTFEGAPTVGAGAWPDADVLLASASHVHVDDNVFTGNLVAWDESSIWDFNGNDVHIQGNQFLGPASGEPISAPFTQGGTYAGLFITDNTFTGCTRFCVEAQIQPTTATVSDLHIDRNTFTDFEGPAGPCRTDGHYPGAISAAGPPSASAEWATGCTLWGNTITLPSRNTNCVWGIEVGWTGTSVERNTIAYAGVAMAVGGMPGTEIENNTLSLLTSGSEQGGCAGGACAFIKDGGYNGTERVGANTIDGATITGCVAPACAMGHGGYGAQPTVTMPSAKYAGGPP